MKLISDHLPRPGPKMSVKFLIPYHTIYTRYYVYEFFASAVVKVDLIDGGLSRAILILAVE